MGRFFDRLMGKQAPSERPPSAGARSVSVDGIDMLLDAREQVLSLAAGEPEGLMRGPSLDSRFVGASVLALKAKQVDDGLYAAVEVAAEPKKRAMLSMLAGALASNVPPSLGTKTIAA